MMTEPTVSSAIEDRASVALRRGREIAERVRYGIGCTDREYRFLAALYELSAVTRAMHEHEHVFG